MNQEKGKSERPWDRLKSEGLSLIVEKEGRAIFRSKEGGLRPQQSSQAACLPCCLCRPETEPKNP